VAVDRMAFRLNAGMPLMSSPGPPPFWTITLPSDIRLLANVRGLLEAIFQQAGLHEEASAAIVLCTHEAAVNVIRHAHQLDAATPMRIHCSITADAVSVELFDEGEPFDIDCVPDFDPAEVRLGGRGVFLIRTLMDEISCQPRPGGGNTLRMLKRLPRNNANNLD
jgi:anti-sigma regulatory factor (Ser/Thr protein kinase)